MMLDVLAMRPGRDTAGWLARIRPSRRKKVACAAGDEEEGLRRGSVGNISYAIVLLVIVDVVPFSAYLTRGLFDSTDVGDGSDSDMAGLETTNHHMDFAMSSEDSANYSDAQSGYSPSTDGTPVLSSSSNVDEAPEPHPYQRSSVSIFRRSESMFLVLLFALIAVLVPAFFFYASSPSGGQKGPSDDSAEALKPSPLNELLPYVPAISTVFRFSFSTSYLLLRPLIAVFSLLFAIFAPISLAVNILFQVLIVLPSKIVTALVQFFYPLYLFCATACIFGAGVGLCGRLLLKGSSMVFVGPHHGDDTSAVLTDKK